MQRPMKTALGASFVVSMLVLAGCGGLPFGGTPASSSSASGPSRIATGSATATGSPQASKASAAKPKAVAKPASSIGIAASPQPKPYDPLLADGSYGYHKKPAFENSGTMTSTPHDTLEQSEIDKLTNEQSASLLKIFRHSPKVHRAIENSGGDLSDVSYNVTGTVPVIASDDQPVNTPWVTAELIAVYPTTDGRKELHCWVYRLRTEKGLDNRPFVSGSVVGYLLSDGVIHNPQQIFLK